MELFTCTQAEREPLWDFWWRFVQLRVRTLDITDDKVILAAVNGVRPVPCSSRLARKPSKTITELHEVMENYIRSDTVHRTKIDALRPQVRPPLSLPQHNQYPRNEAINVNAIESAPPQQQNNNRSKTSINPRC